MKVGNTYWPKYRIPTFNHDLPEFNLLAKSLFLRVHLVLSAASPIIMAALKQPRQSNNRCNLQGKSYGIKQAGHHKKEYVNHVQLCANFFAIRGLPIL